MEYSYLEIHWAFYFVGSFFVCFDALLPVKVRTGLPRLNKY